jgi:hypothetical protein
MSFAAITLCVASQRMFIVVVVVVAAAAAAVYFVIDSVRNLLDTPSYIHTSIYELDSRNIFTSSRNI